MNDLDDAAELVRLEALACARHQLHIEELTQKARSTAEALSQAEERLAAAERRLLAAIRIATSRQREAQ